MHEIKQRLLDDWRDSATRAIEQYAQAENVALATVASMLETWLLDIQQRLPEADWCAEWNALVEQWHSQGIEIVDPSEARIAQVFAEWLTS